MFSYEEKKSKVLPDLLGLNGLLLVSRWLIVVGLLLSCGATNVQVAIGVETSWQIASLSLLSWS